MEEILDYLTKVPAWYLATSVDGQPHVRPFSFAAEEEGTSGCLPRVIRTFGRSCR